MPGSVILRASALSFTCIFLMQACTGLLILSPPSWAGEQMSSPMSRLWAGPLKFHLNTSRSDAPLVDIGTSWSIFCDPLGQSSRDDELRALIKGNTVLVSAKSRFERCNDEYAYLNIANEGPHGIIFFLEGQYGSIPGDGFYSRGWFTSKTNEAMRRTVPMVDVSYIDGVKLRAFALAADQPVHMAVRPDDNPWRDCVDSLSWVLVQRVLVPLGYFGVFLFAIILMSGGYVWGTTEQWVLWLELLPVIVLCFCSAEGDLFDSNTLPVPVHNIMISRLKLCELLTTVLVARYWHAHATHSVSSADLRDEVNDPQTKGWTPAFMSAAVVVFDIVFSCQFTFPEETRWVSNRTGILVYGALHGCGQLGAAICLFWYCGGFLLSSNQSNPRGRRIGTYLTLSACFISLDIVGFFMAVAGHHDSCGDFLVLSLMMNVARIGTAVCQLSVFLPRGALGSCEKRNNNVLLLLPTRDNKTTDDEMSYLRSHNKELRIDLEFEREEHVREKARANSATSRLSAAEISICNYEALVKTLNATIAENKALVKKFQSKIKAERVLYHTAKNSMAEAQGAMEMYVAKHGSDDRSMDGLRDASTRLQDGLEIIWRSLKVASIFEGTYKAKPEVIDLRKWASASGFTSTTVCGNDGLFEVVEPEVAELFRVLSYNNMVIHGQKGGPAIFDSRIEKGYLQITMSNAIRDDDTSTAQQTSSFSTGLGLGDLREVCELRGVDFRCCKGPDGLWHSLVRLEVSREYMQGGTPEAKAAALKMEIDMIMPKHIVIVDDMPSIIAVTAFNIRKRFPDATVDTVRIHDRASHAAFLETTNTEMARSWDLVLMDQHLDLEDGGIVEGTRLLEALKAAGSDACFVMHTGNNTEKDAAEYRSHGSFGVIGKGQPKAVVKKALMLYSLFHRNRTVANVMRKRSSTSRCLDMACGTGH